MSTAALYRRRISRSLEGCRFKLSLRLCLFEEGFDLDLFGFLIALPFLDRWAYRPHEIMESWGVYYFERAVWFCWGRKSKGYYMPWMMTHIKCEVMRPDGTWTPYVASYDVGRNGKVPDGRLTERHSYQYRLKSGEVQDRTATVYAERREWRQKWLRWCPLFSKRRQYIEVEFSDEVGERTGSWKGGVVGTSHEMKPNETMLEALRRMEKERVFS